LGRHDGCPQGQSTAVTSSENGDPFGVSVWQLTGEIDGINDVCFLSVEPSISEVWPNDDPILPIEHLDGRAVRIGCRGIAHHIDRAISLPTVHRHKNRVSARRAGGRNDCA
jgi:hypothetical protein